jgi:hypothetical protein
LMALCNNWNSMGIIVNIRGEILSSPHMVCLLTLTSVSVRKVVPTLTSKSAEIYLSMAGANNTMTRVYPGSGRGSYVQ